MSDAEYQPVMPFVVVTSVGGPYDDQSFVAGYETAYVAAKLEAMETVGPTTIRRVVSPALVPQLDLIAMQHGFTVTTEPFPAAPTEWCFATFTNHTTDPTVSG